MRLLLAVLWTLLCSPLLLGPVFARLGGRPLQMRLGSRVCQLWARGMLRVLGVRAVVDGPPPPREAFVASNHVSWLDILVIAAWRPTTFIAKKEVAHIPAIGFFAGLVGTLFLDRESRRDAHRLAQDLQTLLHGGAGVTLFPEGYCADGASLLPFRASLFAPAAQLALPCVPVAISYDFAPVVWNDGSTAAAHAGRLMRARAADRGRAPIRCRLRLGPALRARDRKDLAQRVRDEIEARFLPFALPSRPESAE